MRCRRGTQMMLRQEESLMNYDVIQGNTTKYKEIQWTMMNYDEIQQHAMKYDENLTN